MPQNVTNFTFVWFAAVLLCQGQCAYGRRIDSSLLARLNMPFMVLYFMGTNNDTFDNQREVGCKQVRLRACYEIYSHSLNVASVRLPQIAEAVCRSSESARRLSRLRYAKLPRLSLYRAQTRVQRMESAGLAVFCWNLVRPHSPFFESASDHAHVNAMSVRL